MKAAYMMILGFGAFHLSRFTFAMAAGILMGKLGKPTLVRETSKIG